MTQQLQQLNVDEKKAGKILVEFYEDMKKLEAQNERGKMATRLIMAINDIKQLKE